MFSCNSQLVMICDELKLMRKELEEIKKSCKRMDEHIQFVNGTYSHLRTPLDWLTKKINRIRGVVGIQAPLPILN